MHHVFNCLFYAMCGSVITAAFINQIYSHPPDHLTSKAFKFGGRLIYLTMWSAAVQIVYYILSTLCEFKEMVCPLFLKELKYLRHLLFIGLVFPLGITVTLIYWGIRSFDKELISPTALEPYYPSWVNHSLHSLQVPLFALDLLLVKHYLVNRRVALILLNLLFVSYGICCLFVYHQCGDWVYPFMRHLSWPGRITFAAACLVFVSVLQEICVRAVGIRNGTTSTRTKTA